MVGLIATLLAPLAAVVAPIVAAAKPSPEVEKERIKARLELAKMRHAERMERIKRRR